jgi:CheY-like chemotaxis protein
MLELAITNLALNARDAMPGGGTLTFATRLVEVGVEDARNHPERRAGVFVCLTVGDTGTGIAPEVLPRIFEPFFTTKRVGQGTGLGLSAVHGIMKQHGGWIEVQSIENLGSRFELFFPPTAEVAGDTTRTRLAKAAAAAGKGTVLLVEDDVTVRHIARRVLERGGFTVLEAEDGPSAEKLWSSHKRQIAVLLTDMVMPNGVNGRELAERLLAERPGLPVVFVSGYSVETTAPDFAASPTQAFLQKPYLPEDLVSAIRRVLVGACGGRRLPG